MKTRVKNKIQYLLLPLVFTCYYSHSIIRITNAATLQIGDNIAGFAPAKILSLKYNIPFYYIPFRYSDLFAFSETEKKADNTVFEHRIRVFSEDDIIKNLDKDNVIFYTDILTKIEYIDPKYIDELKKGLQPKNTLTLEQLPEGYVTIAVHIRKGNGGGEFYDGEQKSLQYFDFDRSKVKYLTDFVSYPFEWEAYQREVLVDKIPVYQTKFPPNQFYIDQIIKLASELSSKRLYVQIFTDDKDPEALLHSIKNEINNPNIVFHLNKNTNLIFKERIIEDLFSMSRFDILLRSQSYFARVAELMGNNKIVIYPLKSHWEDNKLIMDTIVVKGSILQMKK